MPFSGRGKMLASGGLLSMWPRNDSARSTDADKARAIASLLSPCLMRSGMLGDDRVTHGALGRFQGIGRHGQTSRWDRNRGVGGRARRLRV